jgi:hypothetical protein
MDYEVITEVEMDGQCPIALLEEKVKLYLALGWVPCGGISMVRVENFGTKFSGEPYTQVAQALTHPDNYGPLPSDEQPQ